MVCLIEIFLSSNLKLRFQIVQWQANHQCNDAKHSVFTLESFQFFYLQVVRSLYGLFDLCSLLSTPEDHDGLRHLLFLPGLLHLGLWIIWAKLLLSIVVRVEHVLLHLVVMNRIRGDRKLLFMSPWAEDRHKGSSCAGLLQRLESRDAKREPSMAKFFLVFKCQEDRLKMGKGQEV